MNPLRFCLFEDLLSNTAPHPTVVDSAITHTLCIQYNYFSPFYTYHSLLPRMTLKVSW